MPYFIIYVPFLHVAGMALFPFILVNRKHLKEDVFLINHEQIHLRQQVELLIVPFYILYLMNYLFNLLKYRNHTEAYLNIYFEKEAYANEYDLDYLKKRKIWSFMRYI